VRFAAPSQAFDGGDVASFQVEWHGQAGEERFAVDENAAGRAFAKLATVLGAGQAKIFS
jgi:hypothetical protein